MISVDKFKELCEDDSAHCFIVNETNLAKISFRVFGGYQSNAGVVRAVDLQGVVLDVTMGEIYMDRDEAVQVWLENTSEESNCNHYLVSGFGGQGDGVVCRDCGLDKYPEAIPELVATAKRLSRYEENKEGKYMHHLTKPYLREI